MSQPYGGLGQPGERTTRVETLKSEIARIRQTTGGMLLFSIVILLSLINILTILGPWFGWGIGVCVIVCAFVFLRAWIYHTGSAVMAKMEIEIGLIIPLIALLAVWGLVGYDWLASWWLPPCHLGFWFELILVAFHLAAIGVLAFGTWGFWAELVDPSGPTAPRAATHRDKVITPWGQETYGGRFFEEEERPALPPPQTITVEVTEKGDTGRDNHTYVSDLPSLPSFQQFCAHVAQGHVTFAEAPARDYNVPLDDVTDDRGNVLMMGMRSFRQFALDKKWIEWKNPKVHARGVIMSEKFTRILAAIGGIQVPHQ